MDAPPPLSTPPINLPPPSISTPPTLRSPYEGNNSSSGLLNSNNNSHPRELNSSVAYQQQDFLSYYIGSNLIRKRMIPQSEADTVPQTGLIENEAIREINRNNYPSVLDKQVHLQFKSQFEWTLLKKKSIAEDLSLEATLGTIVIGSQFLKSDPKYMERLNSLSPEELDRTCFVVRAYLLIQSKEDTADILEFLIDVGIRFAAQPKDLKKVLPPKSSDAKEIVDTKKYPVLAYLLETIYSVIELNQLFLKKDERLFQKTLQFCFDRLVFYSPPAVREEASKCLTLLSSLNLPKVVHQFTEKMKLCNKNDDTAREWVTYQHAASFLNFGVGTIDQENATVTFFQTVTSVAEKVQRGVLRQEICSSMSQVMETAFSKVSNSDFEKAGPKLYIHFQSLFTTARKWSKKTKLRSICYKLMSALVAYGGIAFFADKGPELVDAFVAGLKDKATRRPYLESVLTYVGSFQPERLESEKEEKTYLEQLDKLLPVLFPGNEKKKEKVTTSDKELLTSPRNESARHTLRSLSSAVSDVAILHDILCLLGTQNPKFLLHRHLAMVMNPINAEFSNDQRGVILKAVATLSFTNPTPFANDSFWRYIHPIFNIYNGEQNSLQQVFFCFPSVSVQDARRQEVAKKVAVIAVSKTEDISSLAVTAMQEFVKLSPDENLELLVNATMEYVNEQMALPWLGNGNSVLLALKNLCVYLQFYLDAIGGRNSSLSPAVWNEMRSKLEMFCLVCLLHKDPQVWAKTIILLDLMDSPVFKRIETPEQIAEKPFLSEAQSLRTKVDMSTDRTWFPGWKPFLDEAQKYKLVVVTVWTWTYDNWRKGASLWKNKMRYLAMFSQMLSLPQRFKLEKFCDSLVNPVLDVAFGSPSPDSIEAYNAILETVVDMDPGTLPLLVQTLEIEEGKRTVQKKKKKADAYLTESVIKFLEQVMQNLTPEVYDSSTELRAVIHYVIPLWIEHWSKVPSTSSKVDTSALKTSVVNSVTSYVYLEGTSTHPTEDPQISLTTSKYIKQIFSFLSNLLSEKSKNPNLEDAILKTIVKLVQFANLKEEFLENKLYSFIASFLELGSHTALNVALALSTCLSFHYDSQLEHYIKMSMSSSELAQLYLNALSLNLIQDTEKWIRICPPSKWLFVTLFHQFSSDLKMRALATDIANLLARKNILFPGYYLPSSALQVADSATELDKDSKRGQQSELFLEFARRYSESLADRYISMTNDFLQEVNRFIKIIDDSDSSRTKRCVLKLITPWMQNLAVFAHRGEVQQYETFLSNLLDISTACDTPNLIAGLQSVWIATISIISNHQVALMEGYRKEITIHVLLDFLIKTMAQQMELTYSQQNQPLDTLNGNESSSRLRSLLRLILLFLSRCELIEVVQYLSFELVNYSAYMPPEPFVENILDTNHHLSLPESIWQPISAFILMIDLTFEAGPSLAPLLPLLLQNATVLYGPTRSKGGPEGIQLIINLILNLGFQHGSTSETRKRSLDLAKQIKETQFNASSEFVKTDFQAETIVDLVDILSGHHPTLANDWTNLALNWALHVNDHSVIPDENLALSYDSFTIFVQLSTQYPQLFTPETVVQLTSLFFKLLLLPNNKLLEVYFRYLQNLPSLVVNNPDTRQLLAFLGNVLLYTSNIPQFKTGLQILKLTGVQGQEVYNNVEEVVRVTLKGLTDAETMKLTVEIMCQMVPFHQSEDRIDNLRIILLLVSSVLVQLDELDEELLNRIRTFAHQMPGIDTALYRTFAQKNLPKADFMTEFFDAFKAQFSNGAHFTFALDTLMILLHRGIERWRYPLFKSLEAILNRYPPVSSHSQATHLNEIVMYFALSSNERLSQASVDVLPHVLDTLALESTPDEFFKLVRKTPSPLYSSTKDDYFHGDTRRDARVAAFHNALSIYTKSFGLSETTTQFRRIEQKLRISANDMVPPKAVLPTLQRTKEEEDAANAVHHFVEQPPSYFSISDQPPSYDEDPPSEPEEPLTQSPPSYHEINSSPPPFENDDPIAHQEEDNEQAESSSSDEEEEERPPTPPPEEIELEEPQARKSLPELPNAPKASPVPPKRNPSVFQRTMTEALELTPEEMTDLQKEEQEMMKAMEDLDN
eukprot:TRINITY_DN1925_c0_g1_i2.p1 TRINITY_DN1925_c0_g1~~TRINITY_DN1925_c0_g1_i2.p1  ORF type:complete len:2091 (+),score=477.46 TRINITY_DN1925_c0_g1_i2:1718-7990(+)